MDKRHSGMFKPGQSGNPLGRPKSDKTIRDFAREHTETAFKTLVEIAQDLNAPKIARIQASLAILDRGWGKPIQYNENEIILTAGPDKIRICEIDLEERIRLIADYQLDNALN